MDIVVATSEGHLRVTDSSGVASSAVPPPASIAIGGSIDIDS